MNRYCMLQFITDRDPDDVAIMYPIHKGHWVKHEEAQAKIDFAIEILSSLKALDINKNTPEELNILVDTAVEQLKK